jgi:pimeloyl-ACP methyl ester carboxylesterase
MSQLVFFAHANGFPSATYTKLFQALEPEFVVEHLVQHGHDPRFPVGDNWERLVDELLHHLQALPGPVLGVGHSLGGVLHLHAALRCPQFYKGVVMLDSPLLGRRDRWAIKLAKQWGLIDRITPAGRTLGRRAEFADRDSARAYFAGKALFRGFDPDCLDAYVAHGLEAYGERVRLRFDPRTEIGIYRSVPHTQPGLATRLQLPLALVQGSHSNVVRRHHAQAARRLRLGEHHELPGGHMFPLERPLQTARLLREIFSRWSAGAAVRSEP